MPEKVSTVSIPSDDDILKSASRRNFIKGVIAGGVAASSASYLFRASTLFGQQPAGLGDRLITLNVNGQQRRVDVMKQETLAWTLRYKLGLTGTKLGCDRAECGACTVLIDDVPHYSCSVLTHTVRDKESGNHRRAGKFRRHAASSAAGRNRRARIPVRILHVRIHYVGGRFSENESQSHPVGDGPRRFRQSMPLPGLRQNPHRHDARRGKHEEGPACLSQSGSPTSRNLDRNTN